MNDIDDSPIGCRQGQDICSYFMVCGGFKLMLTDLIACGVRFHRYLALFLFDKTHKYV